MRSNRLKRQLQRVFGHDDVEGLLSHSRQELSNLNSEAARFFQSFIDAFPDFLTAVDASYAHDARMQRLATSNLELSSAELNSANRVLSGLNHSMNAIMDSLGQGLLAFDSTGKCLPAYSKACLSIFGVTPVGMQLEEILQIPAEDQKIVRDWYKLIFDDRLDFEDWAALGPRKFQHSKGLEIVLEFRPIYTLSGQLASVLMIATDRTLELRAQRQAKELQSYAAMIMKIARSRNDFALFLAETQKLLDAFKTTLEIPTPTNDDITQIKRNLHTIKGAAATFSADRLREYIHNVENRIAEHFDPTRIFEILRQATLGLQREFDLIVSESVPIIGAPCGWSTREELRSIPISKAKKFGQELMSQSVDPVVLTRFVREFVAEPLSDLIRPCEDALREACRSLGKEVQPIVVQGEPPLILRSRYSTFATNLVHVFRNIADHGIEAPQIREKNGKPRGGLVVIRFEILPENKLTLEIEDDGQGIDIEALRKKNWNHVQNLGPKEFQGDRDDQEILNSIFDDGVSSSTHVTRLSGRGIGLAAVREQTQLLGGSVSVTSKRGHYTRFRFELPIYDPIDDFINESNGK